MVALWLVVLLMLWITISRSSLHYLFVSSFNVFNMITIEMSNGITFQVTKEQAERIAMFAVQTICERNECVEVVAEPAYSYAMAV